MIKKQNWSLNRSGTESVNKGWLLHTPQGNQVLDYLGL
jgi:hypothetical protein